MPFFRGSAQNGNQSVNHLYLAAAFGKKSGLQEGRRQPTLVTTIYGGTSEIMKTIIARDVTGLRA